MSQAQHQEQQLNKDGKADQQQIQASKKIQEGIKQAVSFIGNHNRYQFILLFIFSSCFIFATFLLMGTSYFFMSPSFICDGVKVTQEQACTKLQKCHLENTYTITAYAEIYCGDKITERSVIQSMLGIGAVFGVFFINIVSDLRGRKFSLLIAMFFGVLSSLLLIIGAYAKVTSLMMISQLSAGFSANSMLSLTYVLSDKLMSSKLLGKSILITNGFWALAQMSMLFFTMGLTWEHLVVVFMFIPSLGLLILTSFLLVEDPVLLFTQMKYKECKKSLQIIAMFNRTEQKLVQAIELVNYMEKQDSSKLQLIIEEHTHSKSKFQHLHLLKNCTILIPIICIGIFNFGGNMIYYIFNYSIDQTGYSYGVNILLFGVAQFSSVIFMIYFGSRLPRRNGLIVLAIIQTAISAIFFINIGSTLQTALIVCIRFLSTCQYTLVIYLQVETFPQHIQSTCLGVIDTIGQISKFVAPFMVTLAEGMEFSPILICFFSFVICNLGTLIPVKQTLKKVKVKNEPLSESVQTVLL